MISIRHPCRAVDRRATFIRRLMRWLPQLTLGQLALVGQRIRHRQPHSNPPPARGAAHG